MSFVIVEGVGVFDFGDMTALPGWLCWGDNTVVENAGRSSGRGGSGAWGVLDPEGAGSNAGCGEVGWDAAGDTTVLDATC